ncbi:S49 family peptidase [Halorubrum vacuolatum]|uniref:Protease-4 n=1 Tax=Halorubrum vacuolatum TaxID=63740 RepID=A0A238V7R0_HALVU|nr:S49 family peptidase [Halorubrum vacuolatum]SNR30276.1 protease-4 [Halorubrum vacuolatum]
MPANDYLDALSMRQQVAIVVVVATVVAAVFVPVVYGTTSDPSDTVAVVEVEGTVNAALADDVEAELSEARNNDSVGAVVLKLDTSGGQPVASERMYKSVQRTSAEMPVIASVQDISASGGYYAMAPADEIYVLPTSTVGSIGLNAPAPASSPPVEGPSGPDKTGSNEIEQWAQQQTLADTFVDAMMEERGDEFEMPREEVAHADVYLGTEAVHNGFADEIGSLDEAVHEAADRAGMRNYEVDTRETGMDGDLPILIQTDDELVAVYSNDPGYAEVEPMPFAYVYEGAVPHIDTIERFAADDIESAAGDGDTAGSGAVNGDETDGTNETDEIEDRTDETDGETREDGETNDAPSLSGEVSP